MRSLRRLWGLAKFGYRLIPRQPWRCASWRGVRSYIRFRNQTYSGNPDQYPTLREALRFGGWVTTMDQAKRSQDHPLIENWLKKND